MAQAVTPVDPQLPTVVADPSPAAASFDPGAEARTELGRQVQVYVDLGFPTLLGLDAAAFRDLVVPSSDVVAELAVSGAGPGATVADDAVPFVLVLPGVDVNDAVPAMRRGPRHGVSVIGHDEAATYRPLADVTVPPGPYLLWGVDVGSEFCGTTPEQALTTIRNRARTPLTMAEGVALTVLRPDMLRPGRCYSLTGSRTGTNQRVPAVWISDRRPKLGWCWDRNPHTWLGAASAAGRLPLS